MCSKSWCFPEPGTDTTSYNTFPVAVLCSCVLRLTPHASLAVKSHQCVSEGGIGRIFDDPSTTTVWSRYRKVAF